MNTTADQELVQWLLDYIAATESPEALWFVTDCIKDDKASGASYTTNKALDSLRKAVAAQRDRLAEIEHQQALENIADSHATSPASDHSGTNGERTEGTKEC
jgi:hypothetical protein